METVVLVIHILITLALIGVVLLQRSEGGGLGIGGGGGGLMSARGSANLLTRTTAILAASFMATSIILAIFAGTPSSSGSIFDVPAESAPSAPRPEATPDVPLSQ